jgi:hypothetical protein
MISSTPEGTESENTQSVPVKTLFDATSAVDAARDSIFRPGPSRLVYAHTDGRSFTHLYGGSLPLADRRELHILRASLLAALEDVDAALRGSQP